MPRLPHSLLRKARSIDALLPALLRQCRDLGAAKHELRWLREHVNGLARVRRAKSSIQPKLKSSILKKAVEQRATGKPLQYIMGTEYFGDLEIACRPGVLIPRQETAASVSHLTRLIREARDLPSELRFLDLCTGTGCIPLLFQHEFRPRHDISLRLLGVDVSEKSLHLAGHNVYRMRRNLHSRSTVEFMQADVLKNRFTEAVPGPLPLLNAFNFSKSPKFWDILVSNPPYISPSAYWKTTTRSVRNFEPKLALVPPSVAHATDTEQGDAFYPSLLTIARDVEAKIVLLEVADLDQALRVVRMAHKLDIFDGVEIWRDQPDLTSEYHSGVCVIGQGNGRSVLCWRGAGGSWLGKTPKADDAQRLDRSYQHFHNSPLMPRIKWVRKDKA